MTYNFKRNTFMFVGTLSIAEAFKGNDGEVRETNPDNLKLNITNEKSGVLSATLKGATGKEKPIKIFQYNNGVANEVLIDWKDRLKEEKMKLQREDNFFKLAIGDKVKNYLAAYDMKLDLEKLMDKIKDKKFKVEGTMDHYIMNGKSGMTYTIKTITEVADDNQDPHVIFVKAYTRVDKNLKAEDCDFVSGYTLPIFVKGRMYDATTQSNIECMFPLNVKAKFKENAAERGAYLVEEFYNAGANNTYRETHLVLGINKNKVDSRPLTEDDLSELEKRRLALGFSTLEDILRGRQSKGTVVNEIALIKIFSDTVESTEMVEDLINVYTDVLAAKGGEPAQEREEKALEKEVSSLGDLSEAFDF